MAVTNDMLIKTNSNTMGQEWKFYYRQMGREL